MKKPVGMQAARSKPRLVPRSTFEGVQLLRECINRQRTTEIVRALIFFKFSIRFPYSSNVTTSNPIQRGTGTVTKRWKRLKNSTAK